MRSGGLSGSVRSSLFWVALPEGWQSGAPSHLDGTWTGMLAGPDVTLQYTLGVRVQTDMLLSSTRSQASAQQQRMWNEYVIGNFALFSAAAGGHGRRPAYDVAAADRHPTGRR